MKIRVLTGVIIALHGLLRIIFIEKYIDFVIENYVAMLPAESLLTIGAAIIPFIEFFIGLLILTNVNLKKSIIFGACVSVFMVLFIIAGSLYERLIYHALVLLLLTLVYATHNYNSSREKVKRKLI